MLRKFFGLGIAGLAVFFFYMHKKKLEIAETHAVISPQLPDLGPVGMFELTDQDGRPFLWEKHEFGSVWIVNFIFTSCQGPCPLMTKKIALLQNDFKDRSELKFISVTVDPETDKPEVLKDYAAKFEAIPQRWFFLTGSQEHIRQVATHLMLPFGSSLEMHTTRFVLIDRAGHIRGFYDSSESVAIELLKLHVRYLLEPNTSGENA